MSSKGVLLVNLGSPDSTSVSDVRRYLREFLMDGRVLDAAYPIRWFVVNCMILPKRPRESAEAYRSVWLPEGSPLIVISKKVQNLVQQQVDIPVELAMRYQNPSIPAAVRQMNAQGIKEFLMIPLFPHYAMSSFETAVERVREVVQQVNPDMKMQAQPPYYNRPDYIEAMVESAKPYLEKEHDHLLFSYHGIPERHLKVSDPTNGHCLMAEDCCQGNHPAHATCYRAQCFKTTEAFAAKAGISKERYSISFQSRLGREPWLRPYTDYELERFAKEGVKRLLVLCPAFVSDCLETIEEIGMRGKKSFESAGGEELTLIPCMNDHPRWIEVLRNMIREYLTS